METFDLIEKYLFSVMSEYNYLNLRLYHYDINGSIIKISYHYDFDEIDTCYDNILEVDVLDYITFVFNSK